MDGSSSRKAQEVNEETYRREVDERARNIVEHAAQRPAFGMWDAHAPLMLDLHADRVTDAIRQGLETRTSGPAGRRTGGPFHILPCMALLARWSDRISEEGVEIVKDFMTKGVIDRGNTENHWLMYYTGNLLAAERWPDAEMWNGLSSAAMRAEATRWILGIIDRTARCGHHEYDSPQYHIEHMVSMILLADHANDPHTRRQARQVLDLFVADMALEHFYGTWAGGHSREGYRENTWTRTGTSPVLHYLYFGGEAFDPRYHTHGFGLIAATAHYRPPALFADMAWDRSTPYVVRKTKAPRTLYRCVERDPDPVRKYTYMSRSFALGTTQTGLPGQYGGPIDLVSWDLSWRGPRNQAKIVCNHPYRHADRFSAFLVPYQQHAGRLIATGKPYLQWSDRLFGASPYERLMQHEGTAIAAYRIPADDETPFVNLFLPKGTAYVEQGGWLMGDMGDFYTALYPVGPYTWHEIREANNSSIMVVGEGDQIDGWLLRIETRLPGLILEAVEASDVASFEDFRVRRAALQPDLSRWVEAGRIAIETIVGHRLEMFYDGPHRIDEKVIDYAAYPLYDAPGVEAKLYTGKMTFSRGDEKAELDFRVDPSAPLLPMRVIG